MLRLVIAQRNKGAAGFTKPLSAGLFETIQRLFESIDLVEKVGNTLWDLPIHFFIKVSMREGIVDI